MTDTAPSDYLRKMLLGAGDIQHYPYSATPCHYNSLGASRSITWEMGILLKNFVEWRRPLQIVEVGLFRGYSTAWLILGTLLNDMGHIDSYDIYKEGFYGQMWYDYYGLPKGNFTPHHIQKGLWNHEADLPKTIGLLFHDSSHELEDTKREMDVLLPRLDRGCIALFDDMTHPDYAPMQGYLHSLFLSMPNWKWSVVPIGTGLGIAERIT